jgi:hypothetical protein
MRYHFFSNDTTSFQCDTTFFKRYRFFRYRRYHFTFPIKIFKIQTNHFLQCDFQNSKKVILFEFFVCPLKKPVCLNFEFFNGKCKVVSTVSKKTVSFEKSGIALERSGIV